MTSQNAAKSITASKAMLPQASHSNSVESGSQTVKDSVLYLRHLRLYKDQICKVGEGSTTSYNQFDRVSCVFSDCTAHRFASQPQACTVDIRSHAGQDMRFNVDLQVASNLGFALVDMYHKVTSFYKDEQEAYTKLVKSLDDIVQTLQTMAEGPTPDTKEWVKKTAGMDSNGKHFLSMRKILRECFNTAQEKLNKVVPDKDISITRSSDAEAENQLEASLPKMTETVTKCFNECLKDAKCSTSEPHSEA